MNSKPKVAINEIPRYEIQGPQGLSVHFNLAQTGRKKVAMSKLMIPSNSQRRNNFKGEVSFYVPIIYQPQ